MKLAGYSNNSYRRNNMKSDLEIAQACHLQKINKIAVKAGIPETALEYYGNHKAKITLAFIETLKQKKAGKLILVTAINPTKAGEGKSTTTVGLGDALSALKQKCMIALREPSLGPVFGLKGGACGGGYAQVVPMEDINLHFTGDMHAVTTANNLISACIDNHIYQGNSLKIQEVVWKRALDMNDRNLREIEIGLGAKVNGVKRYDGFNISVASEVMAVLCMATTLMDLKARLARMIVGYNADKEPVYVKDLHIEGALAMIMKDAIKPNLAQTLQQTPVVIHGGPFANIAHGCNSIIATKLCMKLADYTVSEAGFGADLGAEKFLNIKCRTAKIKPNAVVIVATIRALKQQGGVIFTQLQHENITAMLKGCANLAKHIDTIQQFQLPYIIAINEFESDSVNEIKALQKWCKTHQHPMSISKVWAMGGEGALDLAKQVINLCEQENHFQPLYDLMLPIAEKILIIAKKVYGAQNIIISEVAAQDIDRIKRMGYDNLPICMAKTPLSLSDDESRLGAPSNFNLHIRECKVSAGAGFIVVFTGKVMTMPGLPKIPAANQMDIDEKGKIIGLF